MNGDDIESDIKGAVFRKLEGLCLRLITNVAKGQFYLAFRQSEAKKTVGIGYRTGAGTGIKNVRGDELFAGTFVFKITADGVLLGPGQKRK